MKTSVRGALVVLGLAAVVYGTASLTGGWLGMPPWWVVRGPTVSLDLYSDGRCVRREWDEEPYHEPRSWDAPVGGAVVAAGLALVAITARRHKPKPKPKPQPKPQP